MFSLKDIFLFKGLSDEEKDSIISSLSKATDFAPNEVIYSDSDFRLAIGILLKGKAYATANNGGKVYMNNFECGTCFGVAAIFGNEKEYVSTIIAKTKAQVLFITENELKEIFLKYPQTALNYIGFLSNKIRFLNTRLKVISSSDTENVVLNYLNTVTDDNGYAQIPNNMSLLARMLGIGRASLYRSLDTLESCGKIIRENNYIKVIKNEKNS